MSQVGTFSDNSPGSVDIVTITGNSGGAVPPDGAGNINLLGSGSVNVAGDIGTNTLTITVAASGMTWNTTSANIANMSVNNGYFCISPGGALTLGLPATSVLGDTITVSLSGATSWQITQAVGQQIRIGNQTTTFSTGSLVSTAQGDSVTLVCRTANSFWEVISMIGNITVN